MLNKGEGKGVCIFMKINIYKIFTSIYYFDYQNIYYLCKLNAKLKNDEIGRLKRETDKSSQKIV